MIKLFTFLSIFIIVFVLTMDCTKTKTNKFADISFLKTKHHFELNSNQKTAKSTFRFVNKGNVPVEIHDIATSCNCVVSEWVKKTLKVGEIGYITVVLDSEKAGKEFFKELVIIEANTAPPFHVLTITAEVEDVNNQGEE